MVKTPLGVIVAWTLAGTRLNRLYYWWTGKTPESCGCAAREQWLNKFRIWTPTGFAWHLHRWHQRRMQDLSVLAMVRDQHQQELDRTNRRIVRLTDHDIAASLNTAIQMGDTYRYETANSDLAALLALNGFTAVQPESEQAK